jgi:hypothetical protein
MAGRADDIINIGPSIPRQEPRYSSSDGVCHSYERADRAYTIESIYCEAGACLEFDDSGNQPLMEEKPMQGYLYSNHRYPLWPIAQLQILIDDTSTPFQWPRPSARPDH